MVKAFIFLASKSDPLLYHIKEVMLHCLAGQGTSENCHFANYLTEFLLPVCHFANYLALGKDRIGTTAQLCSAALPTTVSLAPLCVSTVLDPD